jgi:Cytidylyltransferase family
MAKSKAKARRSSDAESVTSTASNNSRTANNAGLVAPGSPRTQMSKSANGSHPKRKQTTSLNNVSSPFMSELKMKQLLPPLPDLPDAVAVDERQKKVVNFRVRTLWTFILLAGYFTILALGHMYLIALVTVIQIIVYKEVIALAAVPAREKKIPFFKVLNWFTLVMTWLMIGIFWLLQCFFYMERA